jgi:hypothetical protein
MARQRLRVVRKPENGEPIETGFADACRELMDEALADGALAVVVLWESPDAMRWRAAPASMALARGLVRTLSEVLEGDRHDDDPSAE